MHRYLDDGDQPYDPETAPPDDEELDQPPPEVQETQANQAAMAGNPMGVPDNGYYGGAPTGFIPGMVGNINTDVAPLTPPTAPSAPIANPTADNYYQRAKTVSRLWDQYPQRKAPNWLERIAAGALGGAAGYSNAARRAAPIDIQKATEPILYPGYDQKVAQWQSQVVPAEKQLEIAGQQAAAGWKGQQIGAESALKGAQLQYYQQRGQYYANLNPSRLVTVTPEMETATGGKVHRGTQIPASVAAKVYDDILKGGKPLLVRPGEVLLGADNKPLFTNPANPRNTTEWDAYMQANGGDSQKALAAKQKDEIDRARQSRDPTLQNEMMDMRKQRDLESVANLKDQQNAQTLNQRNQQLARLVVNGTPVTNYDDEVKRINNDTAARLHGIQAEFAQKLRGRGIPTDDYDVTFAGVAPGKPGYVSYAPRATAQAAPATPAAPARVPPPAAPPLAAPARTGPPPAQSTPGAAAAGVRLALPNGKVKIFPNQAAAQAFAQEAGLTFAPSR